jgi:hypothetical protein
MPDKINAESLLNLVPTDKLAELAVATRVDHGVKKFTGHLLFKLLVYSMIKTEKASQRTIESFFNSRQFHCLAGLEPNVRTRHSSISERLAQVNVDFFRKLHEFVVVELGAKYQIHEGKSLKIKRFDSTTVSLSSKLLHIGMSNSGDAKTSKRKNGLKQIKFSVGFDGVLAHTAQFHAEQNYLNENLALSEAILSQVSPSEGITVFDRGLRGRKTFALLSEQNIQFVTRIDPSSKFVVLENLSVVNPQTSTLQIEEDASVHLFSTNGKETMPFRLVRAKKKDTGEPLWFLTNIWDIPSDEITEIYRQRWKIEVFFKFLKQQMSFSHLVSRNENGIQVMLYITLIAAMLILVYQKVNQLNGYKYVKMQFVQELEFSLIKEIVILCGGDPKKLDDYPIRT